MDGSNRSPQGSPRGSPRGRYRPDLRNVIGSSAAPYGYTLSTWGAGSVLSGAYGMPGAPEVFAFLGGAVLAFAAVGALAFGGAAREFGAPSNRIELWGAFHFLSVGLAVGAAWAVARGVPGFLGWPMGAAASTAAYLLVVGVEHAAADTTGAASGREE